jgi:hypothetical protein
MSAFCEPETTEVEAPLVRLARNRAEARDRVHRDERPAILRAFAERADVAHDARSTSPTA